MLIRTLEIKKVYSRGDQTVEALNGVSVDIDQGEFVSIMGPSGSGKSTLLQILGGLDLPTSGKVAIGDIAIQDMRDKELSLFRRRKLGFIFQFFNLIPTLSALENVALPLLLDGFPLEKIEDRALELLQFMNLKHRAGHRPSQLSGGEMQRIAIARALITNPLLILADEPTGNLDSKTANHVLSLLKEIVNEQKQTLVMVTHDSHAAEYGSRLILIRDGRVEKDHRLN